jgi:hypothetical protein
MLHTTLNLILTVCGSTLLTSGAVYVIVRFLLKPIWTTLSAYATSYANGQASIDVRIRNLEKLAEEQARLTRTIESIKDEIAADRKSVDDRWAFKKDVYVNLITLLSEFLFQRIEYSTLLTQQEQIDNSDPVRLQEIEKQKAANLDKSAIAYKEYMTHVRIAQLATADKALLSQLLAQRQAMRTPTSAANDEHDQISQEINALSDLLRELARGGRKDLWDTPEPAAGAETAKRPTSTD